MSGYLSDGIKVLSDFWYYRLFLVFLCVLFPVNSVIRYRDRLFRPLFYLFVIGRILSWFLDLPKLSQITLIKLFGQSVTLNAVFAIVVGSYFLIVITLLLEKLLIRLFSGVLVREPRAKPAISLLLRYFLIGLGITLIFGYVGVSATAFAAITGGLSVGIGFGLKEVIGNFVSGIWLLFEGTLKPGDIIIFEDNWCEVTQLGIRATRVKVLKNNSELIIPNQTFFTQNVFTMTGSDRIVCGSLRVGTSYDCNPQQIRQLLLQVAHQHPHVLQEPTPLAFLISFGESSLDFELRFWLDNPLLNLSVTSELRCLVWRTFAENNIEIPYPQRDLHIRSDGNSQVKSGKHKKCEA